MIAYYTTEIGTYVRKELPELPIVRSRNGNVMWQAKWKPAKVARCGNFTKTRYTLEIPEGMVNFLYPYLEKLGIETTAREVDYMLDFQS